MAIIDPIKIDGLAEFSRNLRKIDSNLPKALRVAHNEGAQLIVDWARPRVPRKSGRAARSVKAKSTRTLSRVQGGSTKVPYYPWLDFGGRVGRNRSVRRPWEGEGRYIYPGLAQNYDEMAETLTQSLIKIARDAGIEVDQ